ncbi:MAG TPA: archaetidylserine decarboxylase [Spirochaetota bacterium]|nr:archaetidylserine decarboxylase [Spirochaetota bacterium]HPF05294.1 archaetidylserine decarboxylase [Spirochaetota bacterium]HPJ41032.1 archaetidylserine decarboxylase [Spirochaetota bacterium]HPR36318.1 archaetidylserine decarboxylase [Spirochaetota bacterium]HRX46743.1 archaetidylserine decarboxylase [Spirochaetota bacterium]
MTGIKIFMFKIMPKSMLSMIFGWITLIPLPSGIMNGIIDWYCNKYGVILEEAVIPDGGFRNLNLFFTRELKKGARKIDKSAGSVVSTTDSRVDQFGTITKEQIIQAKGITYSVRDLIPSPEAEKFIGGKFITLYLSPGDYHRIHSPVDGKITGFFNIPGKLYTVQEFMVNSLPGLFAVNERLITYIKTTKGNVAVCKIGAMNVGKISIPYDDAVTNSLTGKKYEKLYSKDEYKAVKKGDEIGTFNLGSTVIILFEKGMIDFSGLKYGRKVKVGEKIGTLK